MGPVLANPETKDLLISLLQEVVVVAQEVGANVSPEFPDQLVEFASNRLPPTHRTSMFADLLEGKRLEVESLNGTVVRLGRQASMVIGPFRPINNTPRRLVSEYRTGTARDS